MSSTTVVIHVLKFKGTRVCFGLVAFTAATA